MLVCSLLSLVLKSLDLFASAKLTFNRARSQKFYPEPSTVNAESILEIESLTSSKYDKYSAGDCFHIEFDTIDAYEEYEEDYGVATYEPFPDDDLTECNFNAAASCSRVSGYVVEIKLLEDAESNDLYGTFGKMKNPYSTHKLPLGKIRYYNKCVLTSTADETTFSKKRHLVFKR